MNIYKSILIITLAALLLSPGIIPFGEKWVQITDVFGIVSLVLFVFHPKWRQTGLIKVMNNVPLFLVPLFLVFSFFTLMAILYWGFGEGGGLVGVLIPLKVLLLLPMCILLKPLCIKGQVTIQTIFRTLWIISIVHVGYVAGQLISGNYLGYYFVGILGSPGPSHAGFVIFILTAFFLSYLINIRFTWPTFFLVLVLLGVQLLVVNRSSIVASFGAVLVAVLLPNHTGNKFRLAFGVLFILGAIGFGAAIATLANVKGANGKSQGQRLLMFVQDSGATLSSANERSEKWQQHFDQLHQSGVFHILFGRGSLAESDYTDFTGTTVKQTTGDNLMVRVVWNFGYFGALLFGLYLVWHLVACWRLKGVALIFISFSGMLIHNLTHELYFITKTIDLFVVFQMFGALIWPLSDNQQALAVSGSCPQCMPPRSME